MFHTPNTKAYDGTHSLLTDLLGMTLTKYDGLTTTTIRTPTFKEVAAEQKRGTAGTCRFCGCAERKACPGGCAWVDMDETVCSTPACVAAWKREDKSTRSPGGQEGGEEAIAR